MNPEELHILVVEDNTDHQFLAEMAIKRLDRKTKTTMCASGEEVLDLLEQGLPEPHLILLDIQLMCGMDGFELASHLKKHETTKNSCLIIFTGHAHEEYVERAQKLGAFAYLLKDMEISLTVTKLKKLIEKWQEQSSPSELV